eukprot:TRINITY_DN63133_c0_g1_i1.p1 TRINITY_DN63133_c0_g1~~TRINITY_DN63133_c0_g1_i1.p1  ORF type:complete len:149 (+),score=43.64 TRINITY_DN63133_c0_g1_i1:2-448(+)
MVGKYDNVVYYVNVRLFVFFFFSSRRRHTRCREVSWARRCVQETGYQRRVHGGPKAFRVLKEAGIDIVLNGGGRVIDVIQQYKNGVFNKASKPNSQGHSVKKREECLNAVQYLFSCRKETAFFAHLKVRFQFSPQNTSVSKGQIFSLN